MEPDPGSLTAGPWGRFWPTGEWGWGPGGPRTGDYPLVGRAESQGFWPQGPGGQGLLPGRPADQVRGPLVEGARPQSSCGLRDLRVAGLVAGWGVSGFTSCLV